DTAASEPGVPTTPEQAASAAVAGKGPRQIRSGDTLGRYEIAEELGEGGMATVFRARDKELRRDVAVKVLFPHLARRDEVVRRFHREARAAAGLEHPNILRIYDVGGGTGDDPPYIVMELIRGRTLLQEIEQRGAILAEVTACIGSLLADALAAAHAAGIIHRDIKPSNVLIAQGGRLLLADFGVARLETEDSLVTRTGALLGTPAYMSPEQASGDTATAKSDLYSLGATLYQLSTGLLPYTGSPAKVMSQIAAGSLVAPVRRSAAVGPDLSRLIEGLMETEPAMRPESAAVIASELRVLANAGGLGDPVEELAAFFDDAAAFLKTRTPAVVTAIVSAGKRALAESKLPRAVALADRASALAPEDPAVKTLVETVTEGGRASRRRTLLAIGAAGILVAGGTTVLALTLRGGASEGRDAAVATDAAIDADVPDAFVPSMLADAFEEPQPIDATPSRLKDAGITRVQVDARTTVADALTVPADAAPPPIDAAASVSTEEGQLIVMNDTWCEISVDGISQGRLVKRKLVKLAVGHHVIKCAQPGINAGWTREVDIEAGKPHAIEGTLLATVEVTIAITGDTVQVDARHYTRGKVVKMKPGRYRAVVINSNGETGAAGWLDIGRQPCRLHEQGNGLVCDP
ncbi:MAG: serine/threonine-protein kinase, partial [Kofleriaceae bacterium]